jgi:hypothetical protein
MSAQDGLGRPGGRALRQGYSALADGSAETTTLTWEARESFLEDRTKEPEPGQYRRNGALGEERAPQFLPAGSALRNRHFVHEQLDRPGGQTISGDGVIAVEGVDLEPVVRELRLQDLDRRGKTAHLHNI